MAKQPKRDASGKFMPKETWFEYLDDQQLAAILDAYEQLRDLKDLADERPLSEAERDRALALQAAAHRLQALGRERQGEDPCACDRCLLVEAAIGAEDLERQQAAAQAAAAIAVAREEERERRRVRASMRQAPTEPEDEPLADDEVEIDIEEEP